MFYSCILWSALTSVKVCWKENQAWLIWMWPVSIAKCPISIFAEQIALFSLFLQVQNLQGWLSPDNLFSKPPPYFWVFQLLNAGCRDNARAPPQRGSCFHLLRCVLCQERGLLECHEACWCSLQSHIYVPLSSSVFGFVLFSGCLSSMCFSEPHFCGGLKAPRRPQVTPWGEAPTAISHFSTCCSQVFTQGTCCIPSCRCVSAILNEAVTLRERGTVKNTARTRNINVSCNYTLNQVFTQKSKKKTEMKAEELVKFNSLLLIELKVCMNRRGQQHQHLPSFCSLFFPIILTPSP